MKILVVTQATIESSMSYQCVDNRAENVDHDTGAVQKDKQLINS